MKGATVRTLKMIAILRISIHAPVKGATYLLTKHAKFSDISIHAPVKGATNTHAPASHYRADFNPRSREGSDLVSGHYQSGAIISIHAPVKGATCALIKPTAIS